MSKKDKPKTMNDIREMYGLPRIENGIKYNDYWERVYEKDKEIERLNNIINRIKSIYQSLCFSAPENNFIFIEQLGEVLQEIKGADYEL